MRRIRDAFHGSRTECQGRTAKTNNLLELIAADPAFNMSLEDLKKSMDPSKYVGRAPLQVDERS